MNIKLLSQLRKTHPAWRLLCSEHAPLVISFLHQVYIEPNVRSLSQSELILKLTDFLYLIQQQDAEAFPKSAYAYLEDWAQNDKGWLRKFYPARAEEASFDLTPATEKVISWLESFQAKQFVGTESRLRILFDLLKQITSGTETSPEQRIAKLQQQKAKIDAEIIAIEKGDWLPMEDSLVKDRFLQFNQVARDLLGDFRQVEQNFRELDQSVRETIATWQGSKGELLEHIFGEQDAIADSDQGKSFKAFWNFLMSSESQDELDELLQKVFSLEAVQALTPDNRLLKVHYDWLEAGDKTQKMVQKLSSQLRRFLDSQSYLENKKIMQQLEKTLRKVVTIKTELPKNLHLPQPFTAFMSLELPKFEINMPMEKKLFSVPLEQKLASQITVDEGKEVDVAMLFEEVFVDELQLKNQIAQQLQAHKQVNLQHILTKHPLQLGVAELVGYLSIASNSKDGSPWLATIDEQQQQVFSWQDLTGKSHQATLPNIIFTRN